MNSAAVTHVVDRSEVDRRAAVHEFLATIRAEQARFLANVEAARSKLDQDDGQLAQLAAIQGRLARQFFDGQRALLKRRAEIDAQLAAVASEGEQRAAELRRIAHECAEVGAPFELDVPELDQWTFDSLAEPGQSVRHEIAALGSVVVRSSEDAEALAAVLDRALAPDDPDGAHAERQLRDVLDGWWKAVNDEAGAQIDDAKARSAMRVHLAAVAAREIAGQPVQRDEHGERGPTMPLADALHAHDDHELDELLATLVDTLDESMPAGTGDLVIRELPEEPTVSRAGAPGETYGGFWKASVVEAHPTAARSVSPIRAASLPSPRDWMPTHVVLPMVAITAAFVLLMAMVG
jgi:hypothetical protein